MKKLIAISVMIIGLTALGVILAPSSSQAQSLPSCATDGDMDGDGVLDVIDQAPKDSGYDSPLVDGTLTGVGDGIDDCE
jgi:hypothetical protein